MDFRERDECVKVCIATSNKAKIEGVLGALKRIGLRGEIETTAWYQDEIPMTLEETVQGAIRRAVSSRRGDCLGVGVEAGFFTAAGVHLGVHVAAVYDGALIAVGASQAFQISEEEYLAFDKRGRGVLAELGTDREKGLVSALTNGAIVRRQLVEEAVYFALVSYMHLSGLKWSR